MEAGGGGGAGLGRYSPQRDAMVSTEHCNLGELSLSALKFIIWSQSDGSRYIWKEHYIIEDPDVAYISQELLAPVVHLERC